MPFGVQFHGAEVFKRAARDLRAAGRKDLMNEMRRDIRTSAKPAVQAAKQAARAIPSKGRGTGLRTRIAAAIGVQIRTGAKTAGVRIRVASSRMPADQRKLPRALDVSRGWRHPVYGNRNAWVTQDGHPYFLKTLDRHRRPIVLAVMSAANRVIDKLTRG